MNYTDYEKSQNLYLALLCKLEYSSNFDSYSKLLSNTELYDRFFDFHQLREYMNITLSDGDKQKYMDQIRLYHITQITKALSWKNYFLYSFGYDNRVQAIQITK